MPAKNLDFIDALRGYAILLVIMVHVSHTESLNLSESLKLFFAQGARGVQLFFLVSAFTLFLSFNNRFNNEKRPIRNFFLRRFFRIAPMFYLAILYYAFQDGFNENRHTFSILSNVFFLHGFTPYWINSIVPGGWSIGIEMLFYLILPFLFFRIKNINQAFNFFLFSIILKGLLQILFDKLDLIDDKIVSANFYLFYFPSQLPIFALGIVLYFIIYKNETYNILSFSNSLVFFSFLIFVFVSTNIDYFFNTNIVYGISFLLFAIGLSKSKTNILINPIVNYIGKISFSIYLVHFAVIHWLTKFYFILYFKNSLFYYCYRYFLVAFISVLLSTMFYKLVEIPCQKLGKKIIDKMEKFKNV